MPSLQMCHAANTALLAMSFMAQLASAALGGHCPPFGAVLPAPTNPTACGAVQASIYGFEHEFEKITTSFNTTAVSVAAQSIHEHNKLLSIHYTPPTLGPSSTDTVDEDTVYRISSISKVFTTLGILLEDIHMNELVTDYLPELGTISTAQGDNSALTGPNWGDITIGALASHMSGIGLDCTIRPHIAFHLYQLLTSLYLQ